MDFHKARWKDGAQAKEEPIKSWPTSRGMGGSRNGFIFLKHCIVFPHSTNYPGNKAWTLTLRAEFSTDPNKRADPVDLNLFSSLLLVANNEGTCS